MKKRTFKAPAVGIGDDIGVVFQVFYLIVNILTPLENYVASASLLLPAKYLTRLYLHNWSVDT